MEKKKYLIDLGEVCAKVEFPRFSTFSPAGFKIPTFPDFRFFPQGAHPV